jgi:hypothetical protein
VDSRRFSRSRRYLGTAIGGCVRFDYRALTFCGALFQNASSTQQLDNSVTGLMPRPSRPTTPHRQRHQAITPARFGLFPLRSPLLRESRLLSFPRGTEMFQFPRFPPPALCVQAGVTPHDGCWVSPFGHLRIKAWSTAPRSFSQSPTSFIGSRRQGIHRWLFIAWKNISKMLVLALQFSRGAAQHRSEPPPGQGRGSTARGNGEEAEPPAGSKSIDRRRAAPSKRKRGFGIRTRVTTWGELNLNRTWVSRTDRQCTN